jgi:predicted RNase H-like nuclease (RuvC/YqgF family)
LFVEHYIDIPEEKVDVVEELTTRVEELEDSLNEQINSAIQLKKELNEHKKIEAIHAVCEGLTQTQVEKMKQLAESVEFTTEEEFADKVVTLRESYFSNTVKSADSSALNEENYS